MSTDSLRNSRIKSVYLHGLISKLKAERVELKSRSADRAEVIDTQKRDIQKLHDQLKRFNEEKDSFIARVVDIRRYRNPRAI